MSTDRLRTLDATYVLSKNDPTLARYVVQHVGLMPEKQQLSYANYVLKSKERYYFKEDVTLIPYCLFLLSQGMQNGHMCSIVQLENICSFLIDGGDEICYCSCRTLFVAASFCVINFGCVGVFSKRPIEFAVDALYRHRASEGVIEALFRLIEQCLSSSCNMVVTSQASVLTGLIEAFKLHFYKRRWLASKALKLLSQFIVYCQVEQNAVQLHLKFFVKAARVCTDVDDMDCLYRVRDYMGPVKSETTHSSCFFTNTGGTHC